MSKLSEEQIKKIFPSDNMFLGRGGDEVNGLEKDTLPNVKIVASGISPYEKDRIFHLIKIDEHLVYLRICKAMPGEDYQEFAVIHEVAELGSQQCDLLSRKYFDGYLTLFPENVKPVLSNVSLLNKDNKLSNDLSL